jgi:WD40 repeat protein
MTVTTFGLSVPEAISRFRDFAEMELKQNKTYNSATRQLLEDKAKELGVQLSAAVSIIEASVRKYVNPEFVPQIRPGSVYSIAFSPDGHFALSGNDDRTLRLWEIESGICLRVFKGHSGPVKSAAFFPDGCFALSCDWKTLRLWDVESGECLRVFKGHSDWITSVAISPDGSCALSGSEYAPLRLWDIESGECLRVFDGRSHDVEGYNCRICFVSVSFSPDGRFVLSGSKDDTLRLWEVASGECQRVFKGHSEDITSVAFSPDGLCALSGSEDNTMRLWNISSGECQRVFKGHSKDITSVAFSPDGSFALSGSEDDTLRLWDAERGECLRVFEGHSHDVADYDFGNRFVSVAFSPDGRYALSGVKDGTIRLWDVESGNCLRVFEEHSAWVNSVAISPDGRFALSGSADNIMRLWDISSGKSLRAFMGHVCDTESEDSFSGRHFTTIAFSPDGRFALSDSWKCTLQLWDVTNGQFMRVFEGSSSWGCTVAFSPDGHFALSGGYDRNLQLWDVASGKSLRVFKGHPYRATSVAFSPDGRYALSGGDDSAFRLWDISSDDCLRVFKGHLGCITSVVFSPDGRFVLSGSQDETLRLWDISSGDCLRVFEGHSGWITTVVISPDGRFVLSGSWDKTLRLWDISSGDCLRVFEGHLSQVTSVAISPNGRFALSSEMRFACIYIWNVSKGELIATRYDFDDGSWGVLTPDGRYDSSDDGDCPQMRTTVLFTSYPISHFKERFFAPGLLAQALSEITEISLEVSAPESIAQFRDVVEAILPSFPEKCNYVG